MKNDRIAFGYKKRSGKDYASSYLSKKYGYTIIRFAEPVYDLSYKIQKYYNFETKKDRELLRVIGMWGRNMYENIWVDIQMKKLEKDKKYVVCDLRFKNEAERLKKNGFVLVKIETENQQEDDEHISETEMDDFEWDVIIKNDFTESFIITLEKLVNII